LRQISLCLLARPYSRSFGSMETKMNPLTTYVKLSTSFYVAVVVKPS